MGRQRHPVRRAASTLDSGPNGHVIHLGNDCQQNRRLPSECERYGLYVMLKSLSDQHLPRIRDLDNWTGTAFDHR